jgi:E3 ubiquitin-protein ligase UBR1
MMISDLERSLGVFLRDLPREFNNRYTPEADSVLRSRLFRSLVADDESKLTLLFPNGVPEADQWVLRDAQGALDGAEYTAAAKGHPCGHIFKAGESTYHCKTCAADDTCVLCARCFAESDHEGHMVYISVSPGNSGCCDCADDEAWVRTVHCTIHSADNAPGQKAAGKTSQTPTLPDELLAPVRMTIAKAFDYMCDVFSCSPEQLRSLKTEDTARRDELLSRLTSHLYGGAEVDESDEEYALVLWNDEKHTVTDVQNQVAKACRKPKSFGLQKAMEVNDIGRSIIHYSHDLAELLRMAAIIEQLKVTVTVRSARDTFREQMCSSIVDWISDISGCSIASDPHVLRNTICEELLRPWRMGSEGINASIGEGGIDDHEHEENVKNRREEARWFRPLAGINVVRINVENDDDNGEEIDDDEDEDDENDMTIEEFLMAESEDLGAEEAMDLDPENTDPLALALADNDMDLDLVDIDTEGPAENFEATLAGYPAPPPPPPTTRRRTRSVTVNESDDGEQHPSSRPDPPSQPSAPFSNLPRTPKVRVKSSRPVRPARYWLETPEEYRSQSTSTPAEDLWQRVRLDYLILYDLRMWKTLRIDLRHLYISTVVTVPQFKRILGLRFAGLYTMLAQLYLIADREPDHSIINLSVQMLTTPSITAEVVERGNFLTNLLAILYTFLTTRQVGFPKDVNPNATLAFDAGAVTNRRMFHFFLDTRYMFQSAFVQEKVRIEPRYLLQFLDLVKLHQGICPNVRAVGEHVEYEADAWISATLIIKEINRLCRQVAEAFKWSEDEDTTPVQRAIRYVAQATFINAFGLERNRFPSAETKEAQTFLRLLNKKRPKYVETIGREATCRDGSYSLPQFDVATGSMSFHHPLHYLLSWLLEAGVNITREEMLKVLHFTHADFKDPWQTSWKTAPQVTSYDSPEIMTMLFEHPLRVCAWLAQMRAGMWVRNGVTLRHQMHQYRGTSQRDVSYQRDIFMLQAGLVLCGNPEESLGERFLAQIVDRFDLSGFVNGVFDLYPGYDEQQRLDVTEEFFHLLIILLNERQNLLPGQDKPSQHVKLLQRDIAHVLCFKPLSFSDISNRLTDRVADSEEFDTILESMTNFRAPEGLNDSGTFELHPRFIELIDPYYAYYNRNQREEAETVYKEYMAKKSSKSAADIVFEPQLQPINSGLFKNLGAFTQTTFFSGIIYWGLEFCLRHDDVDDNAQITRIETMLHVILHLTLLAVMVDAAPDGPRPMAAEDSFVRLALAISHSEESAEKTVVESLLRLSKIKAFASCSPKVLHILKRMSEKWPEEFANAKSRFLPDVKEQTSETSLTPSEDKEAKKKAALERQARVMAQFKAQQTSFMENQGLDWEADDYSDMEQDGELIEKVVETRVCPFPKEPCILCQEDTDDSRIYGTFAFIAPSRILRQTPLDDKDFVQEILDTPENLDQSADAIRPFGVTKFATETVEKVNPDGSKSTSERRGLGKGFPHDSAFQGPVLNSCGHIMHFSCFEQYLVATRRRHTQHISRNHPERPDTVEFICPLCKALGNTFLPIIWKDKHYHSSSILDQQQQNFDQWLLDQEAHRTADEIGKLSANVSVREAHMGYMQKALVSTLASSFPQASLSTQILEARTVDPDSDTQSSEEESRSILPEMVRRVADQFDLNATGLPGLETLVNLTPRLETLTNLASRFDTRNRPATPSSELKRAYNRIEESLSPIGALKPNTIGLEPGTQSSTIRLAETLCNVLAFTVSSTEISYRGVANPTDGETSTFLDTISEQSMRTLRILSETVRTATATAAIKGGIPEYLRETRVHSSWAGQLKKALGDHVPGEDSALASTSLFGHDVFTFFANCAINEVPMGQDMHHLLRLCYSAELLKVIVTFLCRDSVHEETPQDAQSSSWDLSGIKHFQDWCSAHNPFGWSPHISAVRLSQYEFSEVGWSAPALSKLIDAYALAFLRKALLLTHIHFGIDFTGFNENPELSELQRLTKILRLPTPQEIVVQLGHDDEFQVVAARLIKSVVVSTATKERLRTDAQFLAHPTIFELVGLPKHYDTLTEEAIKRRCPTTGKEVTDPAICLFCGEIFCSQASCCMTDRNKGGCFQHREK